MDRMKLYLVQHAEAKREEEDPARPLTERGLEDSRGLAESLASFGVKVNRILHSGKTRALQTAQAIAERLKPAELSKGEALDPLADPALWAASLGRIDEDLMLVGHMPHLGKLCSLLLCGDERLRVGFDPGSAICLEREAGRWTLRWVFTPSHLRQPDREV